MPGGYHRGGRRTAGNGKLYDVPGEGNLKSQFKSSSVKSEVPGTPYKKRGTEWNFVPLALRRLLPDLRAKLACSARSDNALRSGAMLAHEENSNASAYSVWSDRTFYCIGYSTIIINAARTLLTKACKSGFYLIVAFWLRFLFVAELIWAVAAIFHSEANTAGSE